MWMLYCVCLILEEVEEPKCSNDSEDEDYVTPLRKKARNIFDSSDSEEVEKDGDKKQSMLVCYSDSGSD